MVGGTSEEQTTMQKIDAAVSHSCIRRLELPQLRWTACLVFFTNLTLPVLSCLAMLGQALLC